MVKLGMVFTYDGKTAETLNYLPKLDLWACRYCDGSNLVFLFTKEIEERTKKDMKLEYKFYEKNLAPKWLEGDYDLHIEGNSMTMTSKDGKKVEARCHPDDDWRLQVGIDELKERMAEVKKPREIKVGDKVRIKCVQYYDPRCMADFFDDAKVGASDIIKTIRYSDGLHHPVKDVEYQVKAIGKHADAVTKMPRKVVLIHNLKGDTLYVVNYVDLELVAE